MSISQDDFVRLANDLTQTKQQLAESLEREKFFQSEVLKTKQQLKTMKGKEFWIFETGCLFEHFIFHYFSLFIISM